MEEKMKMCSIIREKLDVYIDSNPEKGIWKDLNDIEEITGIEIHELVKGFTHHKFWYNLISNKDGEYTTFKMYTKYNTFWHKLFDAFLGRFS